MKKRRAALAIVIVGILALVGALAWPAVRQGYGFKDTVACMLTTGRNATRYATGYSDAAFAQIRKGMTRDEVLQLLGQPLERVGYPSSHAEMDWKYSQPASRSGHYHLRVVRFGADEKVSAVLRRFHQTSFDMLDRGGIAYSFDTMLNCKEFCLCRRRRPPNNLPIRCSEAFSQVLVV